jgi:hypothetical protein
MDEQDLILTILINGIFLAIAHKCYQMDYIEGTTLLILFSISIIYVLKSIWDHVSE